MISDNTITEVLDEVAAAKRKFPTWPTDPLHALAVLGEEFGELTKDVLQLTYEPHKTSREKVRQEAIQTAAMALRFAASLDAYQYLPCLQHKQEVAGEASAQSGLHEGEHSAHVKVRPVLLTSVEKVLIKWALYRISTESKGYLMRELSNLDTPTGRERAEKLRSEIELADQLIEMLGGYSSVDGDCLVMARPPREAA